jgi:hypothetical protein
LSAILGSLLINAMASEEKDEEQCMIVNIGSVYHSIGKYFQGSHFS